MKLLKSLPGIYMILNICTQHRYVGSTSSKISTRFASHRYLLRNDKHPNFGLQKAWNKYGESSFAFIVLENTSGECLKKEQTWIDFFKENKMKLYNIRPTANGNSGLKFSDKVKLQKSKSMKKVWASISSQKRETWCANARKSWTQDRRKSFAQAVKSARENKMIERGEIKLLSPDNELFNVLRLKDFCIEHNLDLSTLLKVVKGKLKSHKGWTVLHS